LRCITRYGTQALPLAQLGRAQELKDLEDLLDFVAVAGEERFALHKLGEDAAHRPDVNGEAVLLLTQQDLRRPVPHRLYFVCEGLERNR